MGPLGGLLYCSDLLKKEHEMQKRRRCRSQNVAPQPTEADVVMRTGEEATMTREKVSSNGINTLTMARHLKGNGTILFVVRFSARPGEGRG